MGRFLYDRDLRHEKVKAKDGLYQALLMVGSFSPIVMVWNV